MIREPTRTAFSETLRLFYFDFGYYSLILIGTQRPRSIERADCLAVQVPYPGDCVELASSQALESARRRKESGMPSESVDINERITTQEGGG